MPQKPFELSIKRLENSIEETDSVASQDSALSRPVREKKWSNLVLVSVARGLLFIGNINNDTIYMLCGRKNGKTGVQTAIKNIKQEIMVTMGISPLYAFMRCLVFMSKLAFAGTPEGKKKKFTCPEIEHAPEHTISVYWDKWKTHIKKQYKSDNGMDISSNELHSDAYVGIYTLVYSIMENFNMYEEDERLV